MSKASHQSSDLEENKQLVSNFIEDVLNKHDIGAADKYFAQDPIKHNTQVLGTESFKEARQRFFEEFPDSRATIDHIVAEGDKVFAMLTTTATSKQTGKRVTIKSAALYRIENSRIVEHWDVVEATGLPDRKISESQIWRYRLLFWFCKVIRSWQVSHITN